MNDLVKAERLLTSNDYTCVLCKDEEVIVSTQRGVKPLVALFESDKSVKNFCAADKVVGKATAFLYVLLEVRAVYACVISKTALNLLTEHGIEVRHGVCVDNIINRQGDGICPFEEAVLDIVEPKSAYMVIRKKMSELNVKSDV